MALEDPTYTPWSWVPQNWLDQPAQDPLAPPAPQPVEMAQPTLPPPVEPSAPLPPVGSAPEVNAYGMQLDQPVPEMPAPQEQAAPAPTFAPMQPETWGEMPAMPAPTPQPRTGESDQTPLNEDELIRLAHNDPVAYAAFNAQKDAERDQAFREKNARLEIDNAARAEQDWNDYQKHKRESDAVMQQIDQDAIALANEKPKKYEPGALDLIAAVAGMIGAPATGGKNVGLDMVMKRIDDHAQMQREEYARKKDGLDQRRNTYARLRAAGYDDFQATSAFRMASMERARQQMLTEAQNYDPQGTTARKIAGAALTMEQQIAAQRAAAGQQMLDTRLKLAQIAKAEAEAAKLGRAGMGGGAPGIVKPGNLTGAQVTEMVRTAGGSDVIPDKPGGYTTGEARSHVELSASVTGEERKTRTRFVEGITDASNQPFEFASDKEGEAFRKKKAAIADLNALIGDVVKDIDEKGGTVGFANSGLNKKYQSRLANIDMKLKNAFETGALDEGALKVMGKLKGGNVTSMITGGTEGLDTLRDDLVRSFNFDLRSQPGYNGPGYDPPYKPRLPKADAGPAGERLQQTITASYLPAATIEKGRTGKLGPTIEYNQLGSKENVDVHLEQLEKTARANDDAARDAKEALAAIASKATNPEIKKRAADILKTIPKPRTDGAR